ncbi:MAG: hypothetical protein ACO1QS_16375 [Verrucomicrobiota bacterium]
MLLLCISAVILLGAWLLHHPRVTATAPVFRFALLSNLIGLGIGLLTGGSLMSFCILMFLVQLVVLLIGLVLLSRDCEHAHWRSVSLALFLLITPYAAGLTVAVGIHNLSHAEYEMTPPPNPNSRAINLPAPLEP